MHQQRPWLHTAAGLHCHHGQSPAVQQQRRCCCLHLIPYHCSAEIENSHFVTPQSADRFSVGLPCTAQSLQRKGQGIAAAGQLHCFRSNFPPLLRRFGCTQLPVSSFPLSRCCRCCARPRHTWPNHTLWDQCTPARPCWAVPAARAHMLVPDGPFCMCTLLHAVSAPSLTMSATMMLVWPQPCACAPGQYPGNESKGAHPPLLLKV